MEMPVRQQRAREVSRKAIAFFKRWWPYIAVGLALGILLGYANGLITALVI